MANILREGVLDSDPINKDFRTFLWKVWKEAGFGAPSALQYDMAQQLQAGTHLGTRREIGDRLILMGFRGVAKSWVTTCYAVWRLKRVRSEVVLAVSATEAFAKGISYFAWRMISEFDWLADMKPSTDQRRSALSFDVGGAPVSKDESFAALSISGQITGRRATIAIGDDIETPNTSDTEQARTDLRRRWSEIPGAVVKPEGDIYMLGTAQTEQTIYRDYAEDKGYRLIIYPILYPVVSDDPKVDQLHRYGPRLAPLIGNALKANPHLSGTSTEPTRFTELDIMQRQLEWGNTEFDRQFRMFMDAGVGRGNPLRMRDLIVMDIDPPAPNTNAQTVLLPSEIEYSAIPSSRLDIEVDALTGDSHVYGPVKAGTWVPAEEVICSIDTSGSGTDETSWSILGELLGRVFLLHQGNSVEGHTAEVLKAIAADCKKWKATKVLIEKNFGQGMFGELLLPYLQDIGWVCEIEEAAANNQMNKEKRIVQVMEPLMTGHRLVVNAAVLRRDFKESIDYEHVESAKRRYYRLTYQLSRMTNAKGCVKHDDRADSLAGGCAHFVGILKRRIAEAFMEGKLRAVEIEVEKMIAERKRQGLPTFGADIQQGFQRGQHRRFTP